MGRIKKYKPSTTRTSRGPRKLTNGMRFVQRMMRALAVASIVHGMRTTNEHHQLTSTARTTAFAEVLGCLADRLSFPGADPRPGGFDDAFVSFWNHVGGPNENAVKGKYTTHALLIYRSVATNGPL